MSHEREKPIFRDFFVALSQSFSKTFLEFCVYITKRKSEKSLDESFEFGFVDDFVRKFGFVDDLAQKKKFFLLLLLNICFIFLLLFCFIGGLEKD